MSLPRAALVWVAVVVVVLVIVDVVLVGFALGRTAPDQHGAAGPIPTFSSEPTSSSAPTSPSAPSPSGTATTGADADTAGATDTDRRLLSAVSVSEAWRAASGTCGDAAPVLEHSTDAGATWDSVTLGSDVGAVMGLQAGASGVSILAGVGTDCAPTVLTSTDRGATWAAGRAGGAGAGVHDGQIVLSSGTVASPCADPLGAYQGQYTTVVACEKQVDWRNRTGAWVNVPLAGVQSIVDAGNTYTLARVGASGCDGVQVVSLPATNVTASSTVSPMACWTGGGSAGPVAMALSGNALWGWAGDTVTVSENGGATW